MQLLKDLLRVFGEAFADLPTYQDAVPGALAVHRAVAPADRWGVSHAGTGRLVRAFDDLPAAVECARRAAGAIDWKHLRLGDTPETLVGWTPGLADRLIAAIGPGEPGA